MAAAGRRDSGASQLCSREPRRPRRGDQRIRFNRKRDGSEGSGWGAVLAASFASRSLSGSKWVGGFWGALIATRCDGLDVVGSEPGCGRVGPWPCPHRRDQAQRKHRGDDARRSHRRRRPLLAMLDRNQTGSPSGIIGRAIARVAKYRISGGDFPCAVLRSRVGVGVRVIVPHERAIGGADDDVLRRRRHSQDRVIIGAHCTTRPSGFIRAPYSTSASESSTVCLWPEA